MLVCGLTCRGLDAGCLQGEDLDQANYRIIDQLGRITAQGVVNGNRIQLHQPSGSYYLWIEKGQRAFVKKVMMVR